MTSTRDCTPPISGIHSCIQMELFFFCFEGTKVEACYNEEGALTLNLPEIPCSNVRSWCYGAVVVDNRRLQTKEYYNNN